MEAESEKGQVEDKKKKNLHRYRFLAADLFPITDLLYPILPCVEVEAGLCILL